MASATATTTPTTRRRLRDEVLFCAAVTVALATIGLRGGGGLALGPTTYVEMAIDISGGILVAVAALAGTGGRRWGGLSVALFALLAVVTGLSIAWSVQPSASWLETNRTVSYLMVFAGGVILARTVGAWWAGLLAALITTTTAISLWALLTKVFPGALDSSEIYARLREPYQYWNAVGLTAALGVPPALWLGARRSGHGAVNALAYPILAILLLTVLLAYSRGALLAVAVGCAFWFAVVPLRLRGLVVLAGGAAGALAVSAWVFSQETLTKDYIAVGLRETSGHELGVALLATSLVLLAVGLAVGFAAARRAPSISTRKRAGAAVIVSLALVPVALVIALAMSPKGLGGSLSSGWKSLTDPNSQTRVLNDPSRLTSVGSVRARYWDESIKVFKAHPTAGVGAGGYRTARLRYRTDRLDVSHSHGYVVQTAADLGLLGLVASATLLMFWMVATARTLGWGVAIALPTIRAGRLGRHKAAKHAVSSRASFGPEAVGMATLASVVLVFGVHSFVDWTWFVPGTAIVALLAAGWVAGRGPLQHAAPDPRNLKARIAHGTAHPARLALAVLGIVLGLLAARTAWEPLSAVHADNDALALVGTDVPKARELAETARKRDPLSIDPLVTRAIIEQIAGRPDASRHALVAAVRLQPSNPAAWEYLADFALSTQHHPKLAIRLLGPALHLDPQSPTAARTYVAALHEAAAQAQGRADRQGKRRAASEHAHARRQR